MELDGVSLVDQVFLLAYVVLGESGGWRTALASGDHVKRERDALALPFEVGERPHVFRLLLHPDPTLNIGVAFIELVQGNFRKRIELLEADHGDMVAVLFFLACCEFVENLSGAKQHLGHCRGIVNGVVVNDLPESVAFLKLAQRTDAFWMAQQALWREDDQWLPELAVKLAAEDVEETGGGGAVDDLDVVARAKFQKTLDAGGTVPNPVPQNRAAAAGSARSCAATWSPRSR